MDKYICIHGHFYQPPRENPWLEEIEIQDSAFPHHDWNEKITAECYAPNRAARIVDGEGRILNIVNNYLRISFDFGPTLLHWMEHKQPSTYATIIESDRISAERRGGHGNAIAQAYNHMIMPLASQKDKRTQVIWAMKDFEHRFGRKPEGMWLPETAVDAATLEELARVGIKFTILAPHQAKRTRKIDSDRWEEVSGSRIDPTTPYMFKTSSGGRISVFFYDGPISRAVAFENLLANGENFVSRLMGGFSDARPWAQLLHVATDGESYGHHHRFGEMALAYAIHKIPAERMAEFTNYGSFLEKFPPEHEVEIFDNTSWSCAHGIERWRNDCGCNTGSRPKWNQQWRKPLREALDWLKSQLDSAYEEEASNYLTDPWAARDDYIEVILDRSIENVREFFSRLAKKELSSDATVKAVSLLEMQRHAMLMMTSCGWFFDEISGIEAVQMLKYAARAIQIAEDFGRDLEKKFTSLLAQANSNIPKLRDGAYIYENMVKPSIVNLNRVIAHYAISSIVEDYPEESSIYCFDIKRFDSKKDSFGSASLTIGHLGASSKITMGEHDSVYAVLHFGGHDFQCAVDDYNGADSYESMKNEMFDAFSRHSLADAVRGLDKNFKDRHFTLRDLFIEERRKILYSVTQETVSRLEGVYRQIYNENAKFMDYLKGAEAPIPKSFQVAAEYTLSKDMAEWVKTMVEGNFSEDIFRILDDIEKWEINLDAREAEQILRSAFEEKIDRLAIYPEGGDIDGINTIFDIAENPIFKFNFWEAQNLFHNLIKDFLIPHKESLATATDEFKKRYAELVALGERLNFNMGDFAWE